MTLCLFFQWMDLGQSGRLVVHAQRPAGLGRRHIQGFVLTQLLLTVGTIALAVLQKRNHVN